VTVDGMGVIRLRLPLGRVLLLDRDQALHVAAELTARAYSERDLKTAQGFARVAADIVRALERIRDEVHHG
jgi:hypothetical protein